MKTILFFYFDVILNRSVCDAYVTNSSNVDEVIAWRRKCLAREIKEGIYISFTIQIVDKLDLTMHEL